MLFNSFEFLLFLPLIYALYWLTNKNLRVQNLLLLAGSYFFYGWWDWRFLSLLAFSTIVDYFVGLQIEKAPDKKKKKQFLYVSLIVNLGLLGVFKYYNFFIDSWVDAWSALGYTMHVSTMQIVLPVGISFYTFQTLSYSLDIYRGNLKPTKNFISFATFVSFFPQLVAGPIERASHLLPEIENKRKFDYKQSIDGLRLILWGMFKKVIVADTCAYFVENIFEDYTNLSGATLMLGAVYFAIQIYGDFSGYSDIAIGVSKLLGIELMSNFRFPYFAKDIADFWRRWHISLSTWFRDYLYIPIGGSRVSKPKAIRNIFVIFLVSGFWHGANWTFILWGAIHALLFVPLFLFNRNRKNAKNEVGLQGTLIQKIKDLGSILITFILVCFAWIPFRAANINEAQDYMGRCLDVSLLSMPVWIAGVPIVIVLLLLDWGNKKDERLPLVFIKPKIIRWPIYATMLVLVLFALAKPGASQFLYFQF